jgi:hypothetical protein
MIFEPELRDARGALPGLESRLWTERLLQVSGNGNNFMHLSVPALGRLKAGF